MNGTPASQPSTVNCMKSPSPTPASPGSLKKVSTWSHPHIHLHTVIQLVFSILFYVHVHLQFLYIYYWRIHDFRQASSFQPLVTHSLCVLRRKTRQAPNVQPNSTHSCRGEIAMGYLALGNLLNAVTHSHTHLAIRAMCERPADLFMETILCLLVVF